jgi:hypothetical protein
MNELKDSLGSPSLSFIKWCLVLLLCLASSTYTLNLMLDAYTIYQMLAS